MATRTPCYIDTYETGLLSERVKTARERLKDCTLCPRQCRVDRFAGETGICRTGNQAVVASHDAHFGEESPLVGTNGSGTVFFSHCNLRCLFCQNYEISHFGIGSAVTETELAGMMLSLQQMGCHNINFVTPSHVVPQILAAVEIAIPKGLHVPLVYNSSGYDRVETLQLLENVVDIYMPDFKFWDPDVAMRTCKAPDYPEAARSAIKEMHRQVGELAIDERGVAYRGLLVRHLVMPAGMAGTSAVMQFIARELSADTYVNIMPQYRPCGRASDLPELDCILPRKDFEAALQAAKEAGLWRLDRPMRRFMVW